MSSSPGVRWIARIGPILAGLAGLLSPGVVCAQPGWGQDDWNAGQNAVDPLAAAQQQVFFQLPDFDQWVMNGKTPDQVRAQFDTLLALEIQSVDRACQLSETQRRKLELAGRGDVQAFLRRVEQSRAKFQEVRNDQNRLTEIVQEVNELQMKMQAGVFDDASLFHRVRARTLDAPQAARYEEEQRQRRKFRYEAKIQLALAQLESGVPLCGEQRERLIRLLLDETEPPKRFGQQDLYAVLYKMNSLGEEKLRPIFDEAQWRSIRPLLQQAEAMGSHLKTTGFVP